MGTAKSTKPLRLLVVASLRKNGPGTAADVFEDLGRQHSKNAVGMCMARLAERSQLVRRGCIQPEIGRPAYVFAVKGEAA